MADNNQPNIDEAAIARQQIRTFVPRLLSLLSSIVVAGAIAGTVLSSIPAESHLKKAVTIVIVITMIILFILHVVDCALPGLEDKCRSCLVALFEWILFSLPVYICIAVGLRDQDSTITNLDTLSTRKYYAFNLFCSGIPFVWLISSWEMALRSNIRNETLKKVFKASNALTFFHLLVSRDNFFMFSLKSYYPIRQNVNFSKEVLEIGTLSLTFLSLFVIPAMSIIQNSWATYELRIRRREKLRSFWISHSCLMMIMNIVYLGVRIYLMSAYEADVESFISLFIVVFGMSIWALFEWKEHAKWIQPDINVPDRALIPLLPRNVAPGVAPIPPPMILAQPMLQEEPDVAVPDVAPIPPPIILEQAQAMSQGEPDVVPDVAPIPPLIQKIGLPVPIRDSVRLKRAQSLPDVLGQDNISFSLDE